MEICEWCLKETPVIEKHHYPIPKSEGGTETVLICPACHRLAHQGILVDLTLCKDEMECQAVFYWTVYKAIEEHFPGLLEQEKFYDPFHQIHILQPLWKVKGLSRKERRRRQEETALLRARLLKEVRKDCLPFWLKLPKEMLFNPPIGPVSPEETSERRSYDEGVSDLSV